MIEIDILDDRPEGPSEAGDAYRPDRIRRLVERIVTDAGYRDAEISIAIVDDARMRALNAEYLGHDYSTDVLSFRLDSEAGGRAANAGARLEGELIVCRDTARRGAAACGWDAADELLLYIAHGTLHLIGHDDATDSGRLAMRRAETEYLGRIDARLGEVHEATWRRVAIDDP
ncbi:MAG: rRNA maturation RNase YbeY [Planctomycetes bacterium]|nr:rRNA maturation RNase YbeY [Planctomycetota bacterium]